MNASSIIRLQFSSKKQLEALRSALTPEVEEQIGTRSKITIIYENQSIILNVDAHDIVALRAALNAYLRWIHSTITVLQTIEKVT